MELLTGHFIEHVAAISSGDTVGQEGIGGDTYLQMTVSVTTLSGRGRRGARRRRRSRAVGRRGVAARSGDGGGMGGEARVAVAVWGRLLVEVEGRRGRHLSD
uniref:Uncharacterized protein n=1 Tax=Oryza meridionalis TaxID=40149 RepID=A0A0E0DEM5_9ORYZ